MPASQSDAPFAAPDTVSVTAFIWTFTLFANIVFTLVYTVSFRIPDAPRMPLIDYFFILFTLFCWMLVVFLEVFSSPFVVVASVSITRTC